MKNPSRKPDYPLVLVFLGFLFFSCEPPAVYDRYQPLEHTTWEKNKEYFFSFEIKDPSRTYDLTLEIRNNNLYPYRNLWVVCSEDRPVGPIRRDTLECILANEYGKWNGNGISLFQTSVPIRQNFRFTHKGLHTLGFRQIMRDEHLKGIQEIGLRVVQVK